MLWDWEGNRGHAENTGSRLSPPKELNPGLGRSGLGIRASHAANPSQFIFFTIYTLHLITTDSASR